MINDNERFRFIANDIDVSNMYDKLTSNAKEMIAQMEQADRENNFPVYVQVSDDFEVYTKLLAYDEVLTDNEWHLLCAKYSIPID